METVLDAPTNSDEHKTSGHKHSNSASTSPNSVNSNGSTSDGPQYAEIGPRSKVISRTCKVSSFIEIFLSYQNVLRVGIISAFLR